MSNTLKNPSLESITQNDIDVTVNNAATIVAELDYNPDFQKYLIDNNVHLNPGDALEYWTAVGDYTETYTHDNESVSTLEKDSFALIANLPAAMVASYQLDRYRDNLPSLQKRTAKESVCSYNRLVRHFVTEYPQDSDALTASLLEATLVTIGSESHDFLEKSESAIQKTLRGMMHEIGFAQILEAAGIPFREATIEEDLKGKDLIILFNGREIGVDVKASLSEIEAKHKGDSGKPYVVKPNGDIVMFSMLLDKHFEGGFKADESHVAEIADQARGLVIESVIKAIAK